MKRTVSDSRMANEDEAVADQSELDISARADAKEGIRQGMEDVTNGRTRPVEEFFREFEAKHALVVKSRKRSKTTLAPPGGEGGPRPHFHQRGWAG